MRFSKEAIKQGEANRTMSAETPETFARLDGAAQPRDGAELSQRNSRMAGEGGARALELMNNPDEQRRVDGWMNAFGQSNQGVMWNQARMGAPVEQGATQNEAKMEVTPEQE